METTIENVLKKNFPEIIDVNFFDKKVMLGSGERKTIDVTVINIIIDPLGIVSGSKKEDDLYGRTTKREIINFLEKFLGIDWRKYGSKWDISVNKIVLTSVD